jgi:hypothetical protein
MCQSREKEHPKEPCNDINRIATFYVGLSFPLLGSSFFPFADWGGSSEPLQTVA